MAVVISNTVPYHAILNLLYWILMLDSYGRPIPMCVSSLWMIPIKYICGDYHAGSYEEYSCWIQVWIPCWITALDPKLGPHGKALEFVTLSSFTPSQVFHIMPFAPRSLHSSVFCAGSHAQLSVWSALALNCFWAYIAHPKHNKIISRLFLTQFQPRFPVLTTTFLL